MSARAWCGVVACAVLMHPTLPALAQNWPERSMVAVSTVSAGNAADTIARIVLDQVSKIAQYATPEEILSSPANAFVEGFVGHGATLKRLQLERLETVDLRPVTDADSAAPRVPIKATLHDVLDEMIAKARESLVVVKDGKPIGSVALDDVLARVRELRAEAEAREGA